jgi:hypothetical protein
LDGKHLGDGESGDEESARHAEAPTDYRPTSESSLHHRFQQEDRRRVLRTPSHK